MSVRSQGTELFFVDPDSSEPTVIKVKCPTGLENLNGGTADQIDKTCLDAEDNRELEPGLTTPDLVTAPIILDSGNLGHQQLAALKKSKKTIQWMACLSESKTKPVLDSDGNLQPTGDRTCIRFSGYVAQYTFSAAGNDVIRPQLGIQVSGDSEVFWPEA